MFTIRQPEEKGEPNGQFPYSEMDIGMPGMPSSKVPKVKPDPFQATLRPLSLLGSLLVGEMLVTSATKGRPSKLGTECRTGFSIECGLYCIILLLATRGYSQTSNILPEWKDHFKVTPVIANCIFERGIENASGRDEKNLYQFRSQANGFMIREIRSLDEARSEHTAIMNVYAGHFESNYWAIGPGEILRYFPNAERMMKERNNGDAALVYTAETRIYSALYYGINGLDPTTVKWPEETKFTAAAMSGESLSGEVLQASRGRPTVLEWHFERRPETHFILEYAYDRQLDLSYYPSDIRLYRREGTKEKTLSATHKILVLDTSAAPLRQKVFDPTSYVGSRVVTVVFTNNDIYTAGQRGNLTKVLAVSAQPLDVPAKGATKMLRLFLVGFLVFSLIGPYLIWRRYRNKNNKQKE